MADIVFGIDSWMIRCDSGLCLTFGTCLTLAISGLDSFDVNSESSFLRLLKSFSVKIKSFSRG